MDKAHVVDKNGHGHTYNQQTQKVTSTPHPPAATSHGGREPHKCPREDDGTFDPDFEVPFWGDTARLAPSVIPYGDGLGGYVSSHSGGILKLAELPSVDHLGDVTSSGFLPETILTSEDFGLLQTGARHQQSFDRLVETGDETYVVDHGVKVVVTREPWHVATGRQALQTIPQTARTTELRQLVAEALHTAQVPKGATLQDALRILGG